MKDINSLEGHESTGMKLDCLVDLFGRTRTEDELRYLVRSFSNTGLRIGLSSKSVESCILDYFAEEKSEVEKRLADFESQIFGYRIQKLHTGPKQAVYNVPIKSMLGRAAKDPVEVIKLISRTKLDL
jgi:hypothetical protein